MAIPSVKDYMALCVTPRSLVYNEQGIGRWPMWKRFDSIKTIIDLYIDKPYRDFLARPELETDNQLGEDYLYWYTPRSNVEFFMLSNSGDDHSYYSTLLEKTLEHYNSVIKSLIENGKNDEANFLQLSLKYVGDSEDNIFCGGDQVIAVAWGMLSKKGNPINLPKIEKPFSHNKGLHTITYNLNGYGSSNDPTTIKKNHGTVIRQDQIPLVNANNGYIFIGWDRNPEGATVDCDLLFTALYKKADTPPPPPQQKHRVRFFSPSGQILSELDVEHGKRILPGLVPQLPLVNGIVCKGWNGDPLNDIINADRDYTAISKKRLHNVRFLTPDNKVISQFQAEHGTQLVQAQIPSLPLIDGIASPGWNNDPLSATINSDTDFVAQLPHKKRWLWLKALLRWMLLLLGLLLLFFLIWWFLLGKGNINLCKNDCNHECDNLPYHPIRPEPTPTPTPQTGDVQILLSWSNYNDLDIACIDPYGQKVCFSNLYVPSGGQLDIDMNSSQTSCTNNPIENIFWPSGRAPKGQYHVILTYYARHDNSQLATSYTVKVKHGNLTDTYTGTLTNEHQQVNICSFVID